MGGGLMQLAAYGAQDIYLTGNPQITFFKIVYKRHTNFSIETVETPFIGTISTNEFDIYCQSHNYFPRQRNWFESWFEIIALVF